MVTSKDKNFTEAFTPRQALLGVEAVAAFTLFVHSADQVLVHVRVVRHFFAAVVEHGLRDRLLLLAGQVVPTGDVHVAGTRVDDAVGDVDLQARVGVGYAGS